MVLQQKQPDTLTGASSQSAASTPSRRDGYSLMKDKFDCTFGSCFHLPEGMRRTSWTECVIHDSNLDMIQSKKISLVLSSEVAHPVALQEQNGDSQTGLQIPLQATDARWYFYDFFLAFVWLFKDLLCNMWHDRLLLSRYKCFFYLINYWIIMN